MAFRSGDIVLVPFPFTDLSATKRRPALLLSNLGEFDDWLCLPVTSQGGHAAAWALRDQDFVDGSLPKASWIRINRPTVLSAQVMIGRIGTVNEPCLGAVRWSMCKSLECCGGQALMEESPQYGKAEPR